MSIRQAIRSRFKSLDRDREGESALKRKASFDSASSGEVDKQLSPDLQNGPVGAGLSVPRDDEESKSVYELQLTQLQEQLVAAMIENQGLATELEEFKERNKVRRLEADLEFERERARSLEKRLDEDGPAGGLLRRSESEWVEVAHEVTEEARLAEAKAGESGLSWRQRVNNWLISVFLELVEDFTEEKLPEAAPREEDQLTVRKLKENIKRFKCGTKPLYTSVKGLYSVVQWKYPAFSLLAFIVYMYSVWHGWLLPVFLFLLIFKLFINYLRHKGWNINIKYFSDYDDDDRSREADNFRDLGVSDKFNLVLQVARKVQNGLGTIADNLEKLKNLLTWEQPEATARLFLTLCAGFLMACLLDGHTLFLIAGLYMGVKWFVIEYIYHRFPRIKAKHDTVYQIWQTLPTDADLERRYHRAAVNRSVLSDAPPLAASMGDGAAGAGGRLSDDDRGFCELFSLPPTEHPLPGWEGGRRCTLINKEKPLSSAFKHGKLYLSRSFLCFERYKTQSMKNILIPLSDVTSVHKAKPYSWLPGGGMSIEVSVAGYERPYIFGALLGRDEVYDSLMAAGLKAKMAWAVSMEEREKEKGQGKDEREKEREKERKDDSELVVKPQSPRPSPARTVRMSEVVKAAEEVEEDELSTG